MDTPWTKHRFSGGLLALDLANTVVRRSDPVRRIDRFEDRKNLEAFIRAAMRFRVSEVGGSAFAHFTGARDADALIKLRESIDGFVRPVLVSGSQNNAALKRLFDAAAAGVQAYPAQDGMKTFGYFVCVSAMKLLDERVLARCKVCPDCQWLFVDQSKNQSRLWCDMAVCGNRAKARAHYARAAKQLIERESVGP
jgi:predicted RNA-binding Zn ribbon-like protein